MDDDPTAGSGLHSREWRTDRSCSTMDSAPRRSTSRVSATRASCGCGVTRSSCARSTRRAVTATAQRAVRSVWPTRSTRHRRPTRGARRGHAPKRSSRTTRETCSADGARFEVVTFSPTRSESIPIATCESAIARSGPLGRSSSTPTSASPRAGARRWIRRRLRSSPPPLLAYAEAHDEQLARFPEHFDGDGTLERSRTSRCRRGQVVATWMCTSPEPVTRVSTRTASRLGPASITMPEQSEHEQQGDHPIDLCSRAAKRSRDGRARCRDIRACA